MCLFAEFQRSSMDLSVDLAIVWSCILSHEIVVFGLTLYGSLKVSSRWRGNVLKILLHDGEFLITDPAEAKAQANVPIPRDSVLRVRPSGDSSWITSPTLTPHLKQCPTDCPRIKYLDISGQSIFYRYRRHG